MPDRGVPVLMYHSVAEDPSQFPMPWLVYPLEAFERTMADLARGGYHTPTMDELADHMAGRKRLPDKSVVLTFDDGYLDNWVHVHPILARHGLHGVVWVTRDFLEPSDEPRPNDDDVAAGRATPAGRQVWGYLNHGELRALEEAGTLEVQSHASTHTWWFTGSRIVDFHHPGSEHFWMAWNHAPERKTRWLTEDQDELVPWGTPVYENARAMCRRWFPDPGEARALQEHVAAHGGRAFFEREGWRGELASISAAYREEHGVEGELEDEDAWRARVRDELAGVRDYLSREVGIEVHHHCWPGGDYSDETEAIALELGYRTTTIRGPENGFGVERPERVDRIAMPWREFPVAPTLLNRLYFRAKIDSYRGAFPAWQLHQGLRKLRRLARG